MEILLAFLGIAFGCAGEAGLVVGALAAFVATVFAAAHSPGRNLVDGLPLGLWLLLPLLGAYLGLKMGRSPRKGPPGEK